MFLDMLFRNETNTTLPSSRRVVQHIVNLEPVGEHCNEIVQLNLEKDIILVDVGVDEAELGRVSRVEKGVSSDLEHGSNPGSTSDHANFFCEGRSVLELTLGTLDSNFVPNLEQRKVPRNVSLLIGLEIIITTTSECGSRRREKA